MGKKLIIKGADFSANTIERFYVPQTVINAIGTSFFVSINTILTDDVNELSGKTITGFDLLFANKCSGRTMGTKITFNPGTEQEIECSIVCDFETQDESEQKIIHYDLSEPYTFKENDVLGYMVTDATTSEGRGGCSVYRADRPNNTPNFAFLAKIGDYPPTLQYSYQPFMKLYLL